MTNEKPESVAETALNCVYGFTVETSPSFLLLITHARYSFRLQCRCCGDGTAFENLN